MKQWPQVFNGTAFTSKSLAVWLWLAVIPTALLVVYSSYSTRQSFIHWQALLKQEQQLDVEWGQLLLEKSSLASYSQWDAVSAQKLFMQVPAMDNVVMVHVANTARASVVKVP